MAKNNGDITRQQPTVVVTRFSALGDVAMTIPVIYDVCRSYPDTRFVIVTKKPTSGVFINPPGNLEVFGADTRGEFAGPGGLFRLSATIHRLYSPVALVDLHDVTRTKVIRGIARLRGVRVSTIDKGRAEKRRLINRSPGDPLPQLTTSYERYADAFRRAGYAPTGKFSSLFGSEDIPGPVDSVCAEKQAGEKWIAIAPFAAHRGKIYPADLMGEVIARLAAMPHTRLFMFGAGDDERDAIRQWTKGLPNAISLAEKRHGFPMEFNLLRRMDVMLSMDSANMHLASLAGVPVASIWGQTHPCCGFAGWRQNPDNAIGIADMPCRPCSVFGNRECRRDHQYECLRAITPESVVAKINEIISHKK